MSTPAGHTDPFLYEDREAFERVAALYAEVVARGRLRVDARPALDAALGELASELGMTWSAPRHHDARDDEAIVGAVARIQGADGLSIHIVPATGKSGNWNAVMRDDDAGKTVGIRSFPTREQAEAFGRETLDGKEYKTPPPAPGNETWAKSKRHILFHTDSDGIAHEIFRIGNGEVQTARVSAPFDGRTRSRKGTFIASHTTTDAWVLRAFGREVPEVATAPVAPAPPSFFEASTAPPSPSVPLALPPSDADLPTMGLREWMDRAYKYLDTYGLGDSPEDVEAITSTANTYRDLWMDYVRTRGSVEQLPVSHYDEWMAQRAAVVGEAAAENEVLYVTRGLRDRYLLPRARTTPGERIAERVAAPAPPPVAPPLPAAPAPPVATAPATSAKKPSALVLDMDNTLPPPFDAVEPARPSGDLRPWERSLPYVSVSIDDTLAGVRQDLKEAFPGVKFSVKRGSGTAYGYCRVSWQDGPSEGMVGRITGMYQGERFDGMTDSHVTLFHIEERGGQKVRASYGGNVALHRNTSEAFLRAVLDSIPSYQAAEVTISADSKTDARLVARPGGVWGRPLSALSVARESSTAYYGTKRQRATGAARTLASGGTPDPVTATRLRAVADGMDAEIDRKVNNATAQQRPTARRAAMASQMERYGGALRDVQGRLRSLAGAFDAGTVPPVLAGVRTKAAAMWLAQLNYGDAGDRAARAAGLDPRHPDAARAAWDGLSAAVLTPQETRAAAVRSEERELIGVKIDGFFRTPADLAARMVVEAGVAPGMRVLEPSAGSGRIADAIRAAGGVPVCVEVNAKLASVLRNKDFDVTQADFTEWPSTEAFKAIVMNPPFERGADSLHVRTAWKHLAPGGRLVAIVSEGLFFRSDNLSIAFREWVDMWGSSEKLPAGTFSREGTGVAARLVVARKPAATASLPVEAAPALAPVPAPSGPFRQHDFESTNSYALHPRSADVENRRHAEAETSRRQGVEKQLQAWGITDIPDDVLRALGAVEQAHINIVRGSEAAFRLAPGAYIVGPSAAARITPRKQERADAILRKTYEGIGIAEERLATVLRRYSPRAQAVVRSDEPNAVARIDDKLAKLEARQALMVAANKIVRKHKDPDAGVPHLVALGLSDAVARKLYVPYYGRVGFQAFELSNLSAEIRRLKVRSVTVEQRQQAPGGEWEGTLARVVDDAEAMRVRLYFDGKPTEAVRSELKSRAFKWAPSEGAWQRLRTPDALYHAKRIAGVADDAAPLETDAAFADADRDDFTFPAAEGQEPFTVPRWKAGHVGADTVVMFKADGSADEPAQWWVIELDKLIASHHPDCSRNTAHAIPGAQPRDRSSTELCRQSAVIAQKLQPVSITESAMAFGGAPVTALGGHVVQGNGRAIALRVAYDQYPANAAAYRAHLARLAPQLGIDPAAIAAMRQPVLVRMLHYSPIVDAARLKYLGNIPDDSQAKMGRLDAAKSLVRRLSMAQRRAIGRTLAAAQAETLRDMMDEVGLGLLDHLDGLDRTGMLRGGALTVEAKDLLRDVFVGLVFDTEDGAGVRAYQALSNTARVGVDKSLGYILPFLDTPYDLAPSLRKAALLTHEMQAAGSRFPNVEAFLASSDAFTGRAADRYSARDAKLAGLLMRSSTQSAIVDAFRTYDRLASGSTSLFETIPPATSAAAFMGAFGAARLNPDCGCSGAALAYLGVSETVSVTLPSGKRRTYRDRLAFMSASGDRLYIVPRQRVTRLRTAPKDATARAMFERFQRYSASGKGFVLDLPDDAPAPLGTAAEIRYLSDKIMQTGDRKGTVHGYVHAFDAGQRPASLVGDVLLIDRLRIDGRGILN